MGPPQESAPAYLLASGVAAVVNFPLWKAAAMGQSGFKLKSSSFFGQYVESLQPPWRGVTGVMLGMTWARASIFYGSDVGRRWLTHSGCPLWAATAAPPIAISTVVQIVNQPVVRGSIMLQDPASQHTGLLQALDHIRQTRGLKACWHGTSAGVLKTVPKYVTAVAMKEWMHGVLPAASAPVGTAERRRQELIRSANKAVVAGVAGAVLTNPLDVIRNEMFKTDLPLSGAVGKLCSDYPGGRWLARGCDKNLIAVAVPVACTIFLTDLFSRMLQSSS